MMADMSDVDRLLAEFRAAFEADPRTRPAPYLARAGAARRRELAALIDGWLATAPRRAAGAPTAAAAVALDRAERALVGAGGWVELLPALRERARLGRDEFAARLAEALGVGDRAPKVARYYARMEEGRLDPRGVSDRVLEALGALVGTTAARLRAAAGPQVAPAPAVRAALRPRTASASAARREPADEVDRLFTGG
jgi:hypothetical protein